MSVRGGEDQVGQGLKQIWDAMNDPNSRVDLAAPKEVKPGQTEITIKISQQQK